MDGSDTFSLLSPPGDVELRSTLGNIGVPLKAGGSGASNDENDDDDDDDRAVPMCGWFDEIYGIVDGKDDDNGDNFKFAGR